MNKHRFTLIFFGILFSFFILIGCQKNKIFEKNSPENRVQLVTFNVAKNIAIHFNPSVFFDVSNSSNNSPFRSPLNGNNSVKNYKIINDNFGNPALYF